MNNYEGIKRFLKNRDFSMSNLNSFYMDKKLWVLNYLYSYKVEQNEAMFRGVLIEYYMLERLLGNIDQMSFQEWVKDWDTLLLRMGQIEQKNIFIEKINSTIDKVKIDKYLKNADLVIDLLTAKYGRLLKYQGEPVSDFMQTYKFTNSFQFKYLNYDLNGLNIVGISDFEFEDVIIELKTSQMFSDLSIEHKRQISFYSQAANKPVHLLKIAPTAIKEPIEQLEEFKGYYAFDKEELKEQWQNTVKSIEAMNHYLSKFEDNADLLKAQDNTMIGAFGGSYSPEIISKWHSLVDL